MGILGTVLLSVYSGTTFAIFIEIGLYLTEKEQKISWHSFFETRCICVFLKIKVRLVGLPKVCTYAICGICQVAGDTEVKAQIRLQFRDITGQKCMAIRSLIATQKVIFY